MEPVAGYAKLGEQRIAYHIVGEGPVDLIVTAGFWGSYDVEWENARVRLFYERLASFCRVIRFDRRGTGASDPFPLDSLPPWEAFAEEIEAVMDDAGSERAVVMVIGVDGPAGLLFAATRPERTRSLVLFNSTARFLVSDDYPIGISVEDFETMTRAIAEEWGTGTEATAKYIYPSQANDPRFLQWLMKLQRGMMSPTAIAQYQQASAEADGRSLLSSIQVPTLVLHRIDSALTPPTQGQYLAERIDGAEFVEIPGGDNYPFFEHPELTLAAVEEFLTGAHPQRTPNRILASLLFTDIVDSTRQAEEIGDQQWRALLDLHDDVSDRVATLFEGRVIKSTGDGVLAMFDGPGRAIRAATDLRRKLNDVDLQIRAGIHTGEVDLRGEDIGGIAVHLCARVMAEAGPDEIWTTSTVRDLVAGSGIVFEDRGQYSLKGIEEERQLLVVNA